MKKTGSCALKLGTFVVAVLLLSGSLAQFANAQDYDDPPVRVARLGYMQGAVSFQPAGENEWVQAVANRPLTTGDKLWADRDSRAEVQLGSSMINLAPNTGFSFLNLDDRTTQMEVTAGSINIRVWSMNRDSVYEIDTPNQAFTVTEPGRYRIETSENGDSTVVTVWQGSGESTGNGQSYTLRAGQRTTFSGTTSLNAEVEQIGNPDEFDRWSESRERRYDDSPSARYCSRDVVGFDDLDEYGDWRPSPEYGSVWYPRVSPGWAPYHEGHWAWIDPWGWTWVDDASWGYAPFHYGRWAWLQGRWGWVPGPREVYPVYAPALVVFVGGGGMAFGNNVAWFPLGPREVYVPSYRVSPMYVNRVNVSNTTINQTTITSVYNTTIVNKNTTITNVNYANRNVQGAVSAMPRQAFASAQPVSRNAVRVNPNEIARSSFSSRAAVQPESQAVLGARANTAGRVAAPPAAVAQRTVIAKTAAPPPPPSFSARQQVLSQQPGMAIPRQQLQRLAPARPEAQRLVRQAPPARPATATPAVNRNIGQPGARPGTAAPAANERPGAPPAAQPRPGQPAPSERPQPNQPNTRPENQPQPNRPFEPPGRNGRPPAAQPNNAPRPGQPAPSERPQPNQPNTRPENQAQPNRPFEPPARNDRPPAAQPNNVPRPAQPAPNERPQANQPNRPEMNQPPSRSAEPPTRNDRPAAEPNNRPQPTQPSNNRPDSNRMEPNRPPQQSPANDRYPSAQPTPRPTPGQPASGSRPEVNRPEPPPTRAEPNRPEPNRQAEPPRNQPAPRPQNPPPSDRPQRRTPPPDQKQPPQKDQQPPSSPNGKKRPEETKGLGERYALRGEPQGNRGVSISG